MKFRFVPSRPVELGITVNNEVRIFSLKESILRRSFVGTEGELQFPKELVKGNNISLPQDTHIHFLTRLSNGEFCSLISMVSCEVFFK